MAAAGQEAHEVVDAELLQLQHDGAQVGAQDLRVGLLLQVPAEGRLRVQPEALPGLRAPGAPRPLVSARLRSWPQAPSVQRLVLRSFWYSMFGPCPALVNSSQPKGKNSLLSACIRTKVLLQAPR